MGPGAKGSSQARLPGGPSLPWWIFPSVSSGLGIGKEKVGDWGSSRWCHERTEMLILPVYLRENMKSQLDKKEAREGKAKFGR